MTDAHQQRWSSRKRRPMHTAVPCLMTVDSSSRPSQLELHVSAGSGTAWDCRRTRQRPSSSTSVRTLNLVFVHLSLGCLMTACRCVAKVWFPLQHAISAGDACAYRVPSQYICRPHHSLARQRRARAAAPAGALRMGEVTPGGRPQRHQGAPGIKAGSATLRNVHSWTARTQPNRGNCGGFMRSASAACVVAAPVGGLQSLGHFSIVRAHSCVVSPPPAGACDRVISASTAGAGDLHLRRQRLDGPGGGAPCRAGHGGPAASGGPRRPAGRHRQGARHCRPALGCLATPTVRSQPRMKAIRLLATGVLDNSAQLQPAQSLMVAFVWACRAASDI